MQTALLIDIGSTYTKTAVVDLDDGHLIARNQALTTVDTDVMTGVETAVAAAGVNPDHGFSLRLACSSAAGGLKVFAVGKTAELTLHAARIAALGAGAKIVGSCAGKLTGGTAADVCATEPDIVLLAGGADGGESATILHNAEVLAAAGARCAYVVAGNAAAAGKVSDILRSAGLVVRKVANVYPDVDQLQIDEARQAIRELFAERIVEAKGIGRVRESVDADIVPTPDAVLRGCELLAGGTGDERGLGEIALFDIGGATTDVHSVASGMTEHLDVFHEGMKEPRAKRTVEGDLGMRVSAPALLEAVGRYELGRQCGVSPDHFDYTRHMLHLRRHVGYVPVSPREVQIDVGMARTCVDQAMARHVGRLERLGGVRNPLLLLWGKDLSTVRHVIGTGGILSRHPNCAAILAQCLDRPGNRHSLRPVDPQLWRDEQYALWAAGLLAPHAPAAAFRLAVNSLRDL